ncbi:MAG: TIGR02147 family protein [Bacteriovoracaceae bacterium]
MLTVNEQSLENNIIEDDHSPKVIIKDRPIVFDYADYRAFLKDMYLYKKGNNPQYSENAFIFAAGFGKNSRGYLGLLIKGKRNLTSKSIIGFSSAMNLAADEAIYFENMVLFNQAETEKEKLHFFERMKVGAKGRKAKLVKVLDSQFRYLNEWHLVVIRELITLKDFKDSPVWISKRLGGKISAQKAEEAINDLLILGLITRDQTGKLVQSEPVVLFEDNSQNFKNSSNLHKEFSLKAAEAIESLPYEKRAAQLITLSIPKDRFEELRNEMKLFTKIILEKYGDTKSSEGNELVIQLGSQLLQVTE